MYLQKDWNDNENNIKLIKLTIKYKTNVIK